MEQPKNNFKLVTDKKNARMLLPNMLTLIGVCIGLTSIRFALSGEFHLAIIAIIFAALIDGLDGRIARLIKGTSEFGKELDSLTDFVSFGIAPAFILYFWELNNYGKLGWAITLIFSVCCVLRLARFNLTKIETSEEWKNNFFEGIPSPAGGLLILMPLIYELTNLNFGFDVKKVVPYFIDRILFPDGNEINFSEEKKSKTGDYLSQWFGTDEREADNFSIDPRIAFMINDILKEAAQRGTGRKINELGRKDFAAKTGTSNDAESTWFTGFNENILTTVWFGYDNPSSLGNNEFGSTTSLPIWLNYKKQIIDTIPKGKFKKPSGLIARKINLETGELAKPEDERVKFELFLN